MNETQTINLLFLKKSLPNTRFNKSFLKINWAHHSQPEPDIFSELLSFRSNSLFM